MSDFTIATNNFGKLRQLQIVGSDIYGSTLSKYQSSDIYHPMYKYNIPNNTLQFANTGPTPSNISIAVNGNYIYSAFYNNGQTTTFVNGQISKSTIGTNEVVTFNPPSSPYNVGIFALLYDTVNNHLIAFNNFDINSYITITENGTNDLTYNTVTYTTEVAGSVHAVSNIIDGNIFILYSSGYIVLLNLNSNTIIATLNLISIAGLSSFNGTNKFHTGISFKNNFLFVSNNNIPIPVVYSINIQDYDNPQLIKTYTVGSGQVNGLVVDDNYIYISNASINDTILYKAAINDIETPISDICFSKNTSIETDQCIVPIHELKPSLHTIGNERIVAVTKTKTLDNFLVCFEKDALGPRYPSQRTIVSKDHKIYHQHTMVSAHRFIGIYEKVRSVPYDGEPLYNILMEKHSTVRANCLICETLDPTSLLAQLYANNILTNKHVATINKHAIVEHANKNKKLFTRIIHKLK